MAYRFINGRILSLFLQRTKTNRSVAALPSSEGIYRTKNGLPDAPTCSFSKTANRTERSFHTMQHTRFTFSHGKTGVWPTRISTIILESAILALSFLLVASCASSQAATPQPTITTVATHLSITPTVPMRLATATPQLTQQYQFSEQDSGRTVIYTVTSRFGINLSQQKYPEKNLHISCSPSGVLGSVSNLPEVSPPLYTVRYQAIQPGLCTIKDNSFLLTVRIVA